MIARTSPAGNYLAARYAGSSRDMAAAAAYYRAALRADPRNEDLIERTFLVVLANGAVEDAMPLAERLAALDHNQRVARLALAVRALKRGQNAVARTQLTQSMRGPIADLTATLLSAWAAAGAGDVKNAIDSIDRLQGPDWYAVFKDLHAGLILDLAGQRKEAGKRLERAYNLDSNAIRTVDAYARWASRNGDRDTALKVYNEFSKVLPNHPLVDAAVAELKAGKQLAPMIRSTAAGAAEVLFGLGAALGRQGGEDIGQIYLQLSIYLDPEHPLALLSLADLYETLKKPDLAIDAYSRVPASSPLKRNAEIQMSLNLETMERTEEAKQQLDRLIQQKPDDLEAIIALGNVLRSRKQWKDAADVYSKAINQIPEPGRQHWTLFYFRGICYERAKDWPNAEKDLEKALDLYPEQPQVLNYLGYSWVDQGLYLDKALKMIRRAVELRPNDGYIVDSLGWAYYRLGRYDEATTELERAIELKPEDPVINDHLGDSYWRVGRELEAHFQWTHARDNKPEPEDLSKIEEKLKAGLKADATPSKPGSVAAGTGSGG
ncbi:MAG TPA: tetratricopeptide repeat protein [Xanthobacteraceae bacterium]|nr:tetratricopeptide repeat protein [Xanthobacteraceae bacterium]